ncbi:hypothetical protein RCH21_002274 [Arthrobacter sp. PL16]|nr:hypothetical protein [Arthrobacter sp. PL16]
MARLHLIDATLNPMAGTLDCIILTGYGARSHPPSGPRPYH